MRLSWIISATAIVVLCTHSVPAQHGMMRGASQQRVARTSGEKLEVTGTWVQAQTFAKLIEVALPDGKTEQREVTEMGLVYQAHTTSAPLGEVRGYTPDRQPIAPGDLAKRLQKPTVVFVCDAGEKADPAYVALLKPETICLFLPPMRHGAAAPAPADGEPVAEATVPAAAAPAEPTPDKTLPGKAAPDAALAHVDASGKLTLRTRMVSTFDTTAYQTVRKGNRNEQVPLTIKSTTINEHAQELPAAAVSAFDTAGIPITAEALAKALASERPVLVSGDGQPVDPGFLEIIKADTLILAMPANHPGGGDGPPPEAVKLKEDVPAE
jgi:hypothetical protein